MERKPTAVTVTRVTMETIVNMVNTIFRYKFESYHYMLSNQLQYGRSKNGLHLQTECILNKSHVLNVCSFSMFS